MRFRKPRFDGHCLVQRTWKVGDIGLKLYSSGLLAIVSKHSSPGPPFSSLQASWALWSLFSETWSSRSRKVWQQWLEAGEGLAGH